MAKTKNSKNNGVKTIILDFTDFYNKIKEEEQIRLAEEIAYNQYNCGTDEITDNKDEKSTIKPSLWQRFKNLFKRNKK